MERRNPQGKQALLLAAEKNREDFALWLLSEYDVDLMKQDSHYGNTALHFACLSNNLNLARKLFEKQPSLALKQNYQGETAFHIAIRDHKSL